MKNIRDEYKTRDLGEAATLVTVGQRLNKIERDQQICLFVFDDIDHCQLISKKYFFGDLQVNAREFYESISRLKKMIFR